MAGRKGLNPKLLIRKCKTCGKTFRIKPIEFLSGKIRKHCSVECRRRRGVMTCEGCGQEFEFQLSEASHRKFCSVACYRRSRWASSLELLVEEILKEYQIDYRREIAVGRYSIDFVLSHFDVALEVDAAYWHTTLEETETRQKGKESKEQLIIEAGYALVRLSQSELKDHPERKVLKSIFAALQAQPQS